MNLLPIILLLIPLSGNSANGPPPATADPSTTDRYVGNVCIECHRAEGGRLAEMVDVGWAKSVHYENNVACQDCHGGDAYLPRGLFASDAAFKDASHASFNPEFRFLQSRRGAEVGDAAGGQSSYACRECHAWTVERGLGNPHADAESGACSFKRFGGVAMSRERGIAYVCAQCHAKTTEKQMGSPHGSRGAPSCLFCHGDGSHAIRPATAEIVDPRPREEQGRCAVCHSPGTMVVVSLIRETLEKASAQMATSAQQFEELQKMGYRSLGLGEMNAHVDETRDQLRQVQHGCNIREIKELAKSIENVAKRTAYDYELVAALREARGGQTRIAIGVAGLLLLLAGMLLLYKQAFCPRTCAWTTRSPCREALTPPCNDSCPAGNNVQGFIAAAVTGDYDRALEVLLTTTPFPSVCGRICPAPCMSACNRRWFDESINIRELERYIGDHGRCESATQPTRGQRVAVVGSGPAGLSAASHLARLGYPVTVFEREAELGGVLRCGIPEYRLPADVLDREIGRILAYGIRVRAGEFIDKDRLLRLSHEFDAVFVATGLAQAREIDLGGAGPEVVLQGARFLADARRKQVDLDGKDVVVIGGGNVAVDVARTALRLSAASVRMFCLETRKEMPALAEEVEEALEEGIAIHTGWGPAAARRDHGSNANVFHASGSSHAHREHADALSRARAEARGSGAVEHRAWRFGERGHDNRIEFRRCVSVFDERGQFAPRYDDNDRITVETDVLILAIGQAPDRSILPEGSEVYEGLSLLHLTGAPIFVGGDFAVNRGTVTAGIGSGRRAALHIHKALTGEDLFGPPLPPQATPAHIKMHLFARAPRQRGTMLSAEARRSGFAEVYGGFHDNGAFRPAQAEAQRCFSCGVCNQCDRCVRYCPEGIVIRNGDGHVVHTDYCKGCGVCAAECPRGVIQMRES